MIDTNAALIATAVIAIAVAMPIFFYLSDCTDEVVLTFIKIILTIAAILLSIAVAWWAIYLVVLYLIK